MTSCVCVCAISETNNTVAHDTASLCFFLSSFIVQFTTSLYTGTYLLNILLSPRTPIICAAPTSISHLLPPRRSTFSTYLIPNAVPPRSPTTSAIKPSLSVKPGCKGITNNHKWAVWEWVWIQE
jgi:hypothetical protein